MTLRATLLLAALLTSAQLCATPLHLPGNASSTTLRDSFDLRVPMPPTPIRIDGAEQLIYELHITNFSADDLRITQVRVLDVADQRVLTTFNAEAVVSRMSAAGGGTLAPGMHAVLYLELALQRRAPRALLHQLDYSAANGMRTTTHSLTSAQNPVHASAILVLGAPLQGGPWAAVHDPSWPRGHRRVLYSVDGSARIPGRYAIDWVKLDPGGHISAGDPDRVANHLGYASAVLAVADGTVAAIRDDLDESQTVSAHPDHSMADASGNYIALDLGHDRYAYYEHLKPGSLRVKPGQRVRRGQVIAALGFTGDSTGPHLHFHVADRLSPLAAEGIPYVFEHFRQLGHYADIGKLGSERWIPGAAGQAAQRHAERPGSNVVIEFDDLSP